MKRTITSRIFGFFKILLVLSYSVVIPISSPDQSGKTPLTAGKAIWKRSWWTGMGTSFSI
jgi:hypothetical protein